MEANVFNNSNVVVKFILRDIEGNYYGGIDNYLNVWINCDTLKDKEIQASGVKLFDSFNEAREWKHGKCNRACTIKKIVICSYIEELEMSTAHTPVRRWSFGKDHKVQQ